ncbi:hypothetical protein TYRP_021218 [Tyrophagus putrescentiae]|nr:hypothetical protein TYRP_021218 [Tyrophagus putrescentiae]
MAYQQLLVSFLLFALLVSALVSIAEAGDKGGDIIIIGGGLNDETVAPVEGRLFSLLRR